MYKKDSVEQPWKADFRIQKALPNIKAVRSAFFLNFVMITIMVILLLVWTFFEWQVVTVSSMLSSDNAQIAGRKKENTELLRQSSEFEKWSTIIGEMQGFSGSVLKPSEFLLSIGQACPPHIRLSGMAYSLESRAAVVIDKKSTGKAIVYAIAITGTIAGDGQIPMRALKLFCERLESLSAFKDRKMALKPTVKSFERDQALNVYNFTLAMEVSL